MFSQELDKALITVLKNHERVSDVNLTVGRRPQVEIDGVLREVDLPSVSSVLTAEDTARVADEVLGTDVRLQDALARTGAADCACSLRDGTRLRANVFLSRGSYAVVLRVLAGEAPRLGALGLPPLLNEIPRLLNGMVLVTGPTGSGKSTTLAGIIDQINDTRSVHVVTLEDPIEFLHTHRQATINQRELGTDFRDFSEGLRAALRQAPKVILVGEMRDRETVEIGLKAAETGHLLLSTLHTVDAGQTIDRITGLFDLTERPLIRSRLTQVLSYVISQRLLPRKNGGRVAALEIMGSSLRTRELIQNGQTRDKTFYRVIADARPHGWQTFDQHIMELYREQIITEEVARTYSSEIAIINREIDALRTSRGEDTSGIGELEMAHHKRQGH